MTEQTINIYGIPEGYKAVSVTLDPGSRSYHDEAHIKNTAIVTLEKIKPREIRLVETSEETNEGIQHFSCRNSIAMTLTNTRYKWREGKETDIHLITNEDPNDKSRWAEDLILQLDASHEGRNSWLCHYGRSKQAEEERKKSIFEYVESNGRFDISKRKENS